MKTRLYILLALAPFAAHGQVQPISLDNAITQSRTSRANVQAARLRVEQARLSRRALGAFPSSTLLVGYSNDVRVGATDDDLVVSQPIDLFGRTAASRATGDALVLQAEASYQQTLADIQGDIVTLYSETAAANERVRIAKASEDIAARLLGAVKGLVDGGKLPGVQATRVSIELERVKANRELREAELSASSRRLSAAIGLPTNEVAVEGFANVQTQQISDAILARQRADLLALSAEVSAAQAEARVARADRLPQLELQGRRTAWQDSPTAYGARIQLSFPLFDSGRSRAEVSAANRRAEAAKRALDDAVRIAHSELEAAEIEVKAASQQIARLTAVLEATRGLNDKTEIGLREGANTLIDVLDALRTLREIEENIVEARLSLASAQAKHLRATGTLLGGGK